MESIASEPSRLFKDAMTYLHDGHPALAADLLQVAVKLERESGAPRPRMRFLSFYGLTLAMSKGVSAEAVRCCEVAVQKDRTDATLKVNLARVYRMSGRLNKALQTLDRGSHDHPDDTSMSSLMLAWERRRVPLIASLGRNHSINRLWGRLRSGRSAAAS